MKGILLTLIFFAFGIELFAQLTVTVLRSDVLCNGDCNGSGTALPSGGVPPYSYLWDPGTSNQTTQTATGLCAGIYSVTVVDAVVTVVIGSVTIFEPTVLTVVVDSTNVLCNGGNGGTADLTATGATLNRALSLDGVNDYVNANNTANAGYTGGLTMEAWVWIDPAIVSEGIIMAFNYNSGTGNRCWISVWPSGTFNIYAQDAGNGIGTNSYPLGQWHHVAATISPGNNRRLYVNGILEENSGTITNTWQPQGINELFSIGQEWDFPIPSQHFIGRVDEARIWNTVLSQATIVNHASGCCPVDQSHPNYSNLVGYWRMNEGVGTNVGDNTGNGNSGLLINGNTWTSPAQTDWGCYGAGSGYAYDWSTGATTEDISNLVAGTYYCTVTDGNCCIAVDSVIVNQPAVLSSSITPVNVSCNGANDGSGTVSPTGGTSPYTYLWDAGTGNQTTQAATGLGPGTYYVTITDDNNCTTIDSVLITQPVVLISFMDSTDVLCNGDSTGAATVTATGGTPGYLYNWSSGGTGITETGLSAGIYYVTITDANNCTAIDSVMVLEPPVLIPNIVSLNSASCFGYCDGDATASASGGISPYTYVWDIAAGSQTTALATGLCAGTYSVVVTDSNGCDTVISVTINEPPAVIQSISPDIGICLRDSITLNVTGGVSYVWTSGDTTASIIVSPVSDTSYTVTATDAGGCTESAIVNIIVDTSITVDAGPDVTIVEGSSTQLLVSGGSSYLWNPSTGLSCTNCPNPVASPGETTTYVVTDTKPCSNTDSVTVFVDGDKSIYVANVFSPNGDGKNDVLFVRGKGLLEATLIIYDRWGEKVVEVEGLSQGWDGTYRGERLNNAVFVYYVIATYFDDEVVNKQGNVSLVR